MADSADGSPDSWLRSNRPIRDLLGPLISATPADDIRDGRIPNRTLTMGGGFSKVRVDGWRCRKRNPRSLTESLLAQAWATDIRVKGVMGRGRCLRQAPPPWTRWIHYVRLNDGDARSAVMCVVQLCVLLACLTSIPLI